jgi:hypothetical protein
MNSAIFSYVWSCPTETYYLMGLPEGF